MERRNFIVVGLMAIVYAVFPWLRPKPVCDLMTTIAQAGETQEATLVYAIGWRLEPEPLEFTLQGNAWAHPEEPR